MALLNRPFRLRHVLAAVVGLWFFYTFILSSWTGPSSPSSSGLTTQQLLEQHMNVVNASKGPPAFASSFDWGSVTHHYDPGHLEPLPEGRPAQLPPVQHKFGRESASARREREGRRLAVRALFEKNWMSYKEHAWMRDALMPVSGRAKDQFSGWAATLVDSLDTLWIMGFRDHFDEAAAAAATIDFGRTSGADRVNMFETNIRYLGGLLAAYDLSGRDALLIKAIELGGMLYAGFNTDNRMPVDFIDFEAAKTGDGLQVEPNVVSASPGTLSLEFTRLSQITGDARHYDAASRVMRHFAAAQNTTLLPGMWPMFVSMSSSPPNMAAGRRFTLAGCADSLYEYLPKMVALLGGGHGSDSTLWGVDYEAMSRAALEAADRHLLFRPMLPAGDDVLVAGSADVQDENRPRDSTVLDPESEHLSCFAGGMFALAGKLLGRRDWVDTGAKLAKGCAYVYRAFPTGLGPERFDMVPCAGRKACKWDEHLWSTVARSDQEHFREGLPKGFTSAKDARYILRPEAVESLFVLYRVTGRKEFQDLAWDMFQAVAKATETPYANAAVIDVMYDGPDLPPQEDYMESFWLAETLKYFYLIFCPPDVISLDEFVLNTEAHPFRRPK